MKKKTAALMIMLVTARCLSALSFSAGADLLSLDSFLYRDVSLRAEAGMRADDVRISVSAGYYRSDDRDSTVSAFSSSLDFDCYPFAPLGFYVGATLIGHTYFFGPDAPEERSRFTSSIRAGWTLDVMKHLSLDLRASVFDSSLKDEGIGIGQLSRYRFSFLVLYRTGSDKKE